MSVWLPASATPIIIGNNNDGSCCPFMRNDSGTCVGQTMDYQQVYASSSFSGPVAIKSLTFFFASQFGGRATCWEEATTFIFPLPRRQLDRSTD